MLTPSFCSVPAVTRTNRAVPLTSYYPKYIRGRLNCGSSTSFLKCVSAWGASQWKPTTRMTAGVSVECAAVCELHMAWMYVRCMARCKRTLRCWVCVCVCVGRGHALQLVSAHIWRMRRRRRGNECVHMSSEKRGNGRVRNGIN